MVVSAGIYLGKTLIPVGILITVSKGAFMAGYLYLVFSQVGAMFILAAFGVMYAHTGGFGFTKAAALPEAAKALVFVLAFIGFGSKAGVFPFHVWLPHAHPAASSHISAVMSDVMIKTGIYGILRMYALLEWHTPVFGSRQHCPDRRHGLRHSGRRLHTGAA